jgi:hypothetical protein
MHTNTQTKTHTHKRACVYRTNKTRSVRTMEGNQEHYCLGGECARLTKGKGCCRDHNIVQTPFFWKQTDKSGQKFSYWLLTLTLNFQRAVVIILCICITCRDYKKYALLFANVLLRILSINTGTASTDWFHRWALTLFFVQFESR